MSELKPCPFCGATSIEIFTGETFRWRGVRCCEFDAKGPEVRIRTLGEGTQEEWEAQARLNAIAEWNKRYEERANGVHT